MFGQPNNSPFGSPPPQQPGGFPAPNNPAPGFGSPPMAAPFGGGFAAAPAGGGGFNSAPSFGGGGGFPPPASGGFNSNNVPFGQPQQQQAPQQPVGVPNPFGGAPASNAGFGQQQTQQPMGVPNPFGGGPSAAGPAPSMSFGMSSNVMMNNTTAGMTFGAPASSSFVAPASSTGFGSTPASSTGFGSAPASSFSASNPFGGSSSGGGMTFGSAQQQHNRQASSGSVEMGGSESPTPTSAFGSTFHGTSATAHHTGGGMDSGNLSPIPEDTMGDPFQTAAAAPQQGQDFDAEKLARLKAKLEAKKKKMMDRQQKKKVGSANDDDGPSQQQQEAQPRQQSKSHHDSGGGGGRGHRRDRSMSPLPPASLDPEAAANKSRAERNAIRFATTNSNNTATQSFMPSDLRGKTNTPKPSAPAASSAPATKASVTSAVGGEANREDLATAKSLVGTCMFMCPDEELLRRERENDIQLLEIPDPGGIHPPNWTLRNTVVKRFRRSAADYKLDVPEWIRPPDVLEEACSYLEEWVMERDRQGPDRRFPQNVTPNSLDVYQFIWDRTRMIRKDFILQNYVGTGGKCDARAVRCHERIARWHCACEHQLSHINDFVVQQSQQNIAELGQAMKTLNQFYDDSFGRAYIEAPDDEGRETRANINDFSHGCGSDICQGGNPVDYDGSPLNNAADDTASTSRRLIGKAGVNSPSRGTAEPEMRGLYILLTMNNDGGMEVMSYSAALYRERPEIYHSTPVQLALAIFNAKRDYNYVRFFRILRDPATPYLFACLMFKHIELMRKIAFRIMNKTYGAKKKDTGEPFYDEYPLKRLAQVLCFEDMDEAREACRHYSITVKEGTFRSGSKSGTGELVYWRHSDFKEPRDPAKGTILPLRPRKMLKYIESKLHGATRLGVCRGEVSGEGASIAQPPSRTSREVNFNAAQSTAPPRVPASQPGAASGAAAAPSEDDIKRQQQRAAEEEKRRLEEEKRAKLQKEEERRQKAEEQLRQKREEEKKRQLEKQEAARKAEEMRKQLEAEQKRKAKEEKEERERQEKAAKEAKRLKELRDEEERQRQLKEEEARKKAEAEERERQRIEAIRLEEERKQRERREEEERRRREEAERVRKEQERRRMEALRAQEEERKRQEALARKAAQELEERVNKARKLLLLRRWREKLPRVFTSRKKTIESLKFIDPTFSSPSPFTMNPITADLGFAQSAVQPPAKSRKVDTRKILNRILSKPSAPLDVTSLLLQSINGDDELVHHIRSSSVLRIKGTESFKSTFLFKVAVFLPEPVGLEEESMYESVHTWLNRRLEYGKIDLLDGLDTSGTQTSEVRVLFVKADSWGGHVTCDAAMFVIPPSFCNGDWNCARKSEAISSAFECVDQEVPRVAFVLGEAFDAEYYESAHQFLADCLPSDTPEFPVIFPNATSESALEGCLQSSLKSLIQSFTREFPPLVEQVSVVKLACRCISDALWTDSVSESLESAQNATLALSDELDIQSRMIEDSWSGWPAHDFVSEEGYVRNYFAEGIDLPTVWARHQFCGKAQQKLQELLLAFQAASVSAAIGKLIPFAPMQIRHECDELLERRQYRKCIQRVLQSGCIADEMLILPQGTAAEIATAAIQRATGSAGSYQTSQQEDIGGDDGEKDGFSEATEAVDGRSAEEPEAADDADIFKKAQDIFEESRTISPVHPNIMNTPSPHLRPPPSGAGTVSPPPGILPNNKRSWTGMSSLDERGPSPLQSPFTYGFSSPTPPESVTTKRPRAASYRSKDELESSAFTRKLQALLEGTAVVDMDVGTTTLAKLKKIPMKSE